MKPTTKLQVQVIELSAQLPKITPKQSEWAYKKCFDTYATRLRNNIYCLECGHTWKDDSPEWHNEILSPTCPKCQSKLEMFKHNGNCRKTEYFMVLTTKNDFQVQRVIIIHKDMKKKIEARNHFVEVCQHWIGLDGKKTTISLACNGNSMYYDNWSYGSGLEVRGQSNNNNLRDNLNILAIYPERKILPIIKRNGFKGKFYDMPPYKVFHALIKDSLSETLLKTNQIAFFKHRVDNAKIPITPVSITWLPPIKVCIRNNYIVKDVSLWMDYVQLLIYFRKDTKNAKYVCPPNLKVAHDKLVDKKRVIQNKENFEKMKSEIETAQVQYITQKKMFFGLEFVSKNITVKVIESVKQFMDDGDELKHCLFTNEYYKKADSLVLSACFGNKTVETVEVSLSKMKILQSRGERNIATKYNKEIIDLVNKNLNQIQDIVIKTRPRSKVKAVA